jgi:hypothetical protein
MSGLVLAGMLWLGPPVLPDLPAERAAKARAAEEERRRQEAAKQPEPAPEPEPEPEPAAEPEPEADSSAGAPPPAKPKAGAGPVTAEQLHDAAPPVALEAASANDVALWSEDDAVYAAQGPSEPGLGRPKTAPPKQHTPTRTATRLRAGVPLEQAGRPSAPRKSAAFVFGYRIFQTRDAFARPQSWHVGSLEVTPVRRWVRLNLITEVGAEGGAAARDGDRADLYMMQKAGLGAQYPGWITPFVEFQGGAGMARVELFERNDLLLIWSLGLDAGAQWAVTRWMWIHAAVGWVRPTFQRPERAVYHDSFTFKLGIGF